MLRKNVKKWVLKQKAMLETHPGKKAKTGGERAKYNRIRKTALKGIQDLTFLLENLPEKQLKQIFNTQTLTPFLRSLFNVKIEAKSHEEWLKKKQSKGVKERRLRLLKLAAATLLIIGNHNFTRVLLPDVLAPYITTSFPPIENLKAILNVSMREKLDS